MRAHRDEFVSGNWTFEKAVTFQGSVDMRGPILTSLYGDGNKFYVDSTKGTRGNGTSWDKCLGTIDEAVGRCTADNGDVIFVAPGHVETVIAAGGLDLDVAGITIVFLGPRESQGYITFTTAVSADMDVDAAGITLVNPLFIAGIDSLTGPIDVNAADFTIINGEYRDATDIETTDCVIALSAATRLKIDGWKFLSVTETGDQKQSNIQLDGCDDIELSNIDIRGNFFVGCIENVTDEVLNARFKDCYLENLNDTPKPAMYIDANATGSCQNVKCKIYSGTTYVSSAGKLSWDANSEGFMGDGYAGEPIGTVLGTGIEGKVSTAISEIGSVGVKASTAISEIGSVGVKASTAVSEIGSVGVKASTAVSEIGSVGVKASTAISEIGSVGVVASTAAVRASTAVSEIGSVGVKASTAISEIGSVGVKASTAVSEIGSVGVKASTAVSEIGSVGALIISRVNSLYTFLSTRLSVIDSQVS